MVSGYTHAVSVFVHRQWFPKRVPHCFLGDANCDHSRHLFLGGNSFIWKPGHEKQDDEEDYSRCEDYFAGASHAMAATNCVTSKLCICQ